MFESLVAPADLAGLDDAAVIDALAAAGRAESMCTARRLAAIGEVYARRAPADETDRTNWALDGCRDVIAEVSAALRISTQRARATLENAVRLREDFPRVAAAFAAGDIDWRVVAAILNNTLLVNDRNLLARLDAVLADRAPAWSRLSGSVLSDRIDSWVTRLAPAAHRTSTPATDARDVFIHAGKHGLATVHATVTIPDAIIIDDRLDALAATVCPHDPRTPDQRRADALCALAAQQPRLPCRCGLPDCTAGGPGVPLSRTVIHVFTQTDTLAGTSNTPGYIPGFGPIPAPVVTHLADNAKILPLPIPGADTAPEPRYRPSKALADFVRCRDVCCRFPGCTRKAEHCDIDHTIPYPVGPTHASNLKLLCRYHHLLKTFGTGWHDTQLPDGTIIWTAPTGHTYTTTPDGALHFPALATPTGDINLPLDEPPPINKTQPPSQHRPETERRRRLRQERQTNELRLAEQARQHAEQHAADDEPPPF